MVLEWLEEKGDKFHGRRTKRDRFEGHLECALAYAMEGDYPRVEQRLRAARRFCSVRDDAEEISERVQYMYGVCLNHAVHYAGIAAKEGRVKEAEFYNASAKVCAYYLEREMC